MRRCFLDGIISDDIELGDSSGVDFLLKEDMASSSLAVHVIK